MTSLASAIVGFLSLLAGRQLYWVFVGAAGFLLAFNLAERYFGIQSEWLLIVVGLVAGVIGALLAVFAQRLAVGFAGFIAGGFLLFYVAQLLGLRGDLIETVLFIVGGIIGAVLISALFDPALIILSAMLGASLLTQTAERAFEVPQGWHVAILVLLFVIGLIVQFAAWQPARRAQGTKKRES